MSCLNILEINPLLVALFAVIFSHSECCIFISFTVSFAVKKLLSLIQFCSLPQLCPTLCYPIDCSMPDLPVDHQIQEFTQTHVHWVGDVIQLSELVMSSSYLILCNRLLLLPLIFPSISAFSNELDLHIRWPEYWSFSFNISLSNEYSGMISFRMDWWDLLAVQRILKSLLQYFGAQLSL